MQHRQVHRRKAAIQVEPQFSLRETQNTAGAGCFNFRGSRLVGVSNDTKRVNRFMCVCAAAALLPFPCLELCVIDRDMDLRCLRCCCCCCQGHLILCCLVDTRYVHDERV